MSLKQGMKHSEVKNKLKQYSPPHREKVKDSMINQVKIAEGQASADSLRKDINNLNWRGSCDTNFINSKSMAVSCNICLKECVHKRTAVCDACLRFSNLEAI